MKGRSELAPLSTVGFLAHLRELDVRLRAEDGRLRFDAPKDVLTADLRAELTRRKSALLDVLRAAPGDAPIEPVARDGELPLSFSQERLWFLAELEPGTPAYNLPEAVRLAGRLDAAALEHVYRERLRPNPGAEQMIAGLRTRGIKIGLVSGGFTFFTERLKARLRLDYARANTLEIVDGRITGKILGTIVGAEGKRAFLLELCQTLGITPQQAIAMGDGANDLLMMNAAGLSVAYHAKPKVQAQAHTALNYSGLDGVLALLA